MYEQQIIDELEAQHDFLVEIHKNDPSEYNEGYADGVKQAIAIIKELGDYKYSCLCGKDNCNIWGQAEHEKTEVKE